MMEWFTYNPQNPLLFTRIDFWVFFVIIFGVFSLIYKNTFWRNTWLFAVSLFFYYKAGGFFFVLLLLSIIINFGAGLLMYNSGTQSRKKWWLAIAIAYNLFWLAYFKYTYFFADLSNQYLGTNITVKDWMLSATNEFFGSNFEAAKIILPVGISFYTFQIISYLVDLYREEVKPIKNILDFGFYVSFFPQLVAGPIVRASNFVPQMYAGYKVSKKEASWALFLILNGLIKKVVIADYLSVNYIDRVFDNPLSYSGLENLWAIYGYSIQIYCDFSGYTDIAIGLALWMGFRLPLNFNSPYKAVSITDFWRRWHISLSSWLKDYLYIPLGGNRKGKVRTYVNLGVTMLLGGLWHGANIRFVIWGALHGFYLIIHKLWLSFFPKSNTKWNWLKVAITFHLVTLTWIAFRAPSMQHVQHMFTQMANNMEWEHAQQMIVAYWKVLALLSIAFIVHWLPTNFKEWYQSFFINLPTWVKLGISLVVVFILVQFTTADVQPFIYFQF